jgi:predicted nucleotidyltransferase
MEILEKLRALKKDLKNLYGIEKIAVFGSVARGEYTSNSDVDIVILQMRKKNGFTIAKARKFLTEKLNRKVDLGLYDSMNPFIKKIIKRELIDV